jgi:hypothetical protein
LDEVTDAVKVKGDANLHEKNTIYLELLSIGQKCDEITGHPALHESCGDGAHCKVGDLTAAS